MLSMDWSALSVDCCMSVKLKVNLTNVWMVTGQKSIMPVIKFYTSI